MDCLAVIGAPALAAWGISVEHRCISATARRLLGILIVLLECCLIEGIVIGGTALLAAFASCFLLVLFIEAFLALNIIPSARGFRDLFRHLPLDLRIIAPGGREVFHTDAARKLDNTTLYTLSSTMPEDARNTVLRIRTDLFPDAVFKLYRPHAGVAVLTEDASELLGLQQQLEQQRDLLVRQNEVLRRQQGVQMLVYRQQRERELGERVEQDLTAAVTRIRSILDDRIADSGERGTEERLEQLNLVKILVAYCKRKGMLALAGAESTTMSSEQLDTIARESMADLRSIGIECAVFVTTSEPVAISAVNILYDSFYDCIISVLPRANPVMMVSISHPEPDLLVMRATIECAIGLESGTAVELIPQIATSTEPWTAVQTEIAHELEGRLAARGGDYSIGLEDGLVSVVVKAHAPSAVRMGGDAR